MKIVDYLRENIHEVLPQDEKDSSIASNVITEDMKEFYKVFQIAFAAKNVTQQQCATNAQISLTTLHKIFV